MEVVTSWITQYVFQSVFHSFLVAFIIESLMRFWRVHDPATRLRFLLLTLWLPALTFPLFQLLYPERGSYRFRGVTALFDLNAWMLIRIWDGLQIWHLALAMLAAIALLFLIQDLVPILHPYMHRSQLVRAEDSDATVRLKRAMKSLGWKQGTSFPEVILVESDGPILHLSGVRRSSVYMNLSLVKALDDEELSGMLAHEAAHFLRRDPIMSSVLLFFRVLVFFNPVALIEFRRIIHEREKLCDDLASGMTGQPLAVAAGLAKVFRLAEPMLRKGAQKRGQFHSVVRMLELSSHRSRVEDRITRLLHPGGSGAPAYPEIRLGITMIALLALLFFVV